MIKSPARGPDVTAYAWLVFALTFGLLISDYMARQVLSAVFPLLKAEWHLSDSRLGLLSGVVAITVQEALETLSTKVGLVLLVLGGMHFFNLFVFAKMRRRALRPNQTPPVIPSSNALPRGHSLPQVH